MRKAYQIDRERAVRSFQQFAAHDNPTVQLPLPMVDIVAHLQQGVGHLLRQAGLELMQLIMQEEVRSLVGEKSQPNPERTAHRWGAEQGHAVIDGQKVPIERPRVRQKNGKEIKLGSYELFRREAALDTAVWNKLVRGLSTRHYDQVVREFADAYGIEKSAVSEHFIQASRAKLKQLLERPLKNLRFCAVLIDGTPYQGHHMIVALGVGVDGKKTVLGLREGASENKTVVSELLSDLVGRELDLTQPLLWVLDGGKALQAAVRQHAGERATLQRCQVHKRRNVVEQLPEEYRAMVDRKMAVAYAMAGYAEARRALDQLHRELMDLNPSAARSLAEGMEETLTLHRLGVPASLRKSLASTNLIESAFSVVETVCRNVKRWRPGDQVERWVGSGLIVAEAQFRRVDGYREIPKLIAALSAQQPSSVAQQVVGA